MLNKRVPFVFENEEYFLSHGSVVIAAITSCTNTSNPSVMLGAGLYNLETSLYLLYIFFHSFILSFNYLTLSLHSFSLLHYLTLSLHSFSLLHSLTLSLYSLTLSYTLLTLSLHSLYIIHEYVHETLEPS